MNKRMIAAAGILAVFAAVNLYAEEPVKTEQKKDNPPVTLIGSSDVNFSGFGAFSYQGSKIGKKYANLPGFRAGLIVNDAFVIGFNGYGLAYPNKREKISGKTYTGIYPYMELGYGGLLLEYHFMPKSLIHFSTGITVGGGSYMFTDINPNGDDYDEEDENSGTRHHGKGNTFFYAEPEVNAYINVTRFCRIGAGVSYRYTYGAKGDDFKDKDFRFAGGTVQAQFGWF